MLTVGFRVYICMDSEAKIPFKEESWDNES